MRRRRHVSRLFAFVAVLVALASSARAEPGLQPDAPIRVGIISFMGPFSQQYIQYGANCLSDALIRVGRFQVVERANIERILAEQRFQTSGFVDPHTAAQLGRILGIDYAVVATLDRCEYKTESWTDKNGTRHYYHVGDAEASVRFVDTSTGTIVASVRTKGSATDSSSVSKACLDAVGACFKSGMVAELTELFAIRGRVLEASSKDKVYIYVGRESGVKPGAHFEILRPSVTQIGGMQLSDDSSFKASIAVVQVIEVSGAIARAKVVESAKDIQIDDYAIQLGRYTSPGEKLGAALLTVAVIVLAIVYGLSQSGQ